MGSSAGTMRYGISAGAIVTDGARILLVHHQGDGLDFWVPPGGALEGDESVFDCARREAFEETGLRVDLDRIVYIEEFVEPDYHFCKFHICARTFSGELSLGNLPADETFLVDARFFSRDELDGLTVYPPILMTRFWDDLEAGFPETRYLGLRKIG